MKRPNRSDSNSSRETAVVVVAVVLVVVARRARRSESVRWKSRSRRPPVWPIFYYPVASRFRPTLPHSLLLPPMLPPCANIIRRASSSLDKERERGEGGGGGNARVEGTGGEEKAMGRFIREYIVARDGRVLGRRICSSAHDLRLWKIPRETGWSVAIRADFRGCRLNLDG